MLKILKNFFPAWDSSQFDDFDKALRDNCASVPLDFIYTKQSGGPLSNS